MTFVVTVTLFFFHPELIKNPTSIRPNRPSGKKMNPEKLWYVCAANSAFQNSAIRTIVVTRKEFARMARGTEEMIKTPSFHTLFCVMYP